MDVFEKVWDERQHTFLVCSITLDNDLLFVLDISQAEGTDVLGEGRTHQEVLQEIADKVVRQVGQEDDGYHPWHTEGALFFILHCRVDGL